MKEYRQMSVIERGPEVPGLKHSSGKVRESYTSANGTRAILVTDRISVFDWYIGCVPFKGQVLNAITVYWLQRLTRQGVPNHLLGVPHPNVTYNIDASAIPVEFVVRGYLTGTTTTSSWYAYQHHNRMISGVKMPEGMRKNEPFSNSILTPSTKGESGHDESMSPDYLFTNGLIEPEIYEEASSIAVKMFEDGQKQAIERGLILADTKYEFGISADGKLMVIDEVHTPDSSRYWIAENYEEQLSAGKEPESLDKEFVRRMIVEAGYDVDGSKSPKEFFNEEIRDGAAARYATLYERFLGEPFQPEYHDQEALAQAIEGIAAIQPLGKRV